jgi:hypothetical protein
LTPAAWSPEMSPPTQSSQETRRAFYKNWVSRFIVFIEFIELKKWLNLKLSFAFESGEAAFHKFFP